MSRTAVIIPTYNEEAHIGPLLEQLLAQPKEVAAEILVADGRSTDATRAIVDAIASKDARVRLVDNPARRQSAGINLAAATTGIDIETLIRIDAHSEYPADYIPRLLAAFEETGADSVVVRLDTVGRTCLQRAIAAVSNSRIGTGGSAHRVGGFSGFVDHGHHAAFRRKMFERAGGYDPSFIANEDAELDFRIRKIGGRIWLAGDIEVTYFPRRTLSALFKQYFRYGAGRARNFLKHGERLRPRQLVTPALVAGIAVSLLASFAWPWALLLPAAYLAALAGFAVLLAASRFSACMLLAAPALAAMHIAWGTGFLTHLLFRRTAKRNGV